MQPHDGRQRRRGRGGPGRREVDVAGDLVAEGDRQPRNAGLGKVVPHQELRAVVEHRGLLREPVPRREPVRRAAPLPQLQRPPDPGGRRRRPAVGHRRPRGAVPALPGRPVEAVPPGVRERGGEGLAAGEAVVEEVDHLVDAEEAVVVTGPVAAPEGPPGAQQLKHPAGGGVVALVGERDVPLPVVVAAVDADIPRRDQGRHRVAVHGQLVLPAVEVLEPRHPPAPLVGRDVQHRLAVVLRGAPQGGRRDRRPGAAPDHRADPLVERRGDERLLPVAAVARDGHPAGVHPVQAGGVVQHPAGEPGPPHDEHPRRVRVHRREARRGVPRVGPRVDARDVPPRHGHQCPLPVVPLRQHKRPCWWRRRLPPLLLRRRQDLHHEGMGRLPRRPGVLERELHEPAGDPAAGRRGVDFPGARQGRHAVGRVPEDVLPQEALELLPPLGPRGGRRHGGAVREPQQVGQLASSAQRGRGGRGRGLGQGPGLGRR